MNVKVEALDQHKVSVGIELPAEVVQKGFKKAVSRIANQVRIPGFRKGKANRKILEMQRSSRRSTPSGKTDSRHHP